MWKGWSVRVLSFILGLAAEAAAVLELAGRLDSGWPPALAVLAFHGGACLLFAPWFLSFLPTPSQVDKLIGLLLILGFSLCFPVLGPLMTGALLVLLRRARPHRQVQGKYYFGDDAAFAGGNEGVHEKITRSIIDILNHADTEARRRAILAVKQIPVTAAIPILRQAQQDSDVQVAIFAKNLLNHIVEGLEESLQALQKESLDSEESAERFIHLANRYEDLVELGLVSASTRQEYHNRAIQLLAQQHEREPLNEKVLCLLVKFALKNNDLARAQSCLELLKNTTRDPEAVLPWELELTFARRDWERLATLLDRLKSNPLSTSRFRRLLEFWSPVADTALHGS